MLCSTLQMKDKKNFLDSRPKSQLLGYMCSYALETSFYLFIGDKMHRVGGMIKETKEGTHSMVYF